MVHSSSFVGLVLGDATDEGINYKGFQHGVEAWEEKSRLSHAGLNTILSLPNLVSVDIRRRINTIPGKSLIIRSLKLHTLHLTRIGVNESLLLKLVDKCKSSLLRLCLSHNKNITDDVLNKILDYCGGELTSLKISDTKVTNVGLLQVVKLVGRRLKTLHICKTSVTGENLSEFSESLLSLEDLKCNNSNLTDTGLLDLLWLCGASLTYLDISTTQVDEGKLSEYSGTLPRLEELNFSNCIDLSDEAFLQMLRLYGSSLKSLYIGETNITGVNLSQLRGSLPCLENLNCSNYEKLEKDGFLQIMRLCGRSLKSLNLKTLNVGGTYITDDCLEIIHGKFDNLYVEHHSRFNTESY